LLKRHDLRQQGHIDSSGSLASRKHEALELSNMQNPSGGQNALGGSAQNSHVAQSTGGAGRHAEVSMKAFVKAYEHGLRDAQRQQTTPVDFEVELRLLHVGQSQFRRALNAVKTKLGRLADVAKTRKVVFPKSNGLRIIFKGHNQTEECTCERKRTVLRRKVRLQGRRGVVVKGVLSSEQVLQDQNAVEAAQAAIALLRKPKSIRLPAALMQTPAVTVIQPDVLTLAELKNAWPSLLWTVCSQLPTTTYANLPLHTAQHHIPFGAVAVACNKRVDDGKMAVPERYRSAIVREVTRYTYRLAAHNTQLDFSMVTTRGRGVHYEIELEALTTDHPIDPVFWDLWARALVTDPRLLQTAEVE
jgi:hypothetical protein